MKQFLYCLVYSLKMDNQIEMAYKIQRGSFLPYSFLNITGKYLYVFLIICIRKKERFEKKYKE